MRPGDVVRISHEVYGEYAVVEKATKKQVDVYATNGSTAFELAYDPEGLHAAGYLLVGSKYATHGGSRFVRCEWRGTHSSQRFDVKVRDGKNGEEETRARYVRRMAFEQFVEVLPRAGLDEAG